MWLDNDSPGCFYDTIDCKDCGGCNPSPLEMYLKDKEENEEVIETEIKYEEYKVIRTFICDKCKKEIIVENDEFELQETYRIRFTGGYSSIFGDMNNISCDLCQECLYELISDFCVYNGENNES